MMYAMISGEKVIDVIDSDNLPKYPPTADGTEIISVVCEGSAEIGMRYDFKTGEFSYPVPIPQPQPRPTQLDRIEEAVNQKNSDIAAAAIDAYTLELMEGGLL